MQNEQPPPRAPRRRRGEPLTPEQRSLKAKIGAHESWAATPDPAARTAPGRQKFLERFEREVDPDGVLPEAERARRAQSAKAAYFSRLALASSKARSKAKGSRPAGECDVA